MSVRRSPYEVHALTAAQPESPYLPCVSFVVVGKAWGKESVGQMVPAQTLDEPRVIDGKDMTNTSIRAIETIKELLGEALETDQIIVL